MLKVGKLCKNHVNGVKQGGVMKKVTKVCVNIKRNSPGVIKIFKKK